VVNKHEQQIIRNLPLTLSLPRARCDEDCAPNAHTNTKSRSQSLSMAAATFMHHLTASHVQLKSIAEPYSGMLQQGSTQRAELKRTVGALFRECAASGSGARRFARHPPEAPGCSTHTSTGSFPRKGSTVTNAFSATPARSLHIHCKGVGFSLGRINQSGHTWTRP
jgi:hypothetical protein